MIDKTILDKLKTEIINTQSITIVPHLNPDGDAMGSSLGLKSVLKNLGRDVEVVTPSGFPKFLSWMNGAGDVVDFEADKQAAIQRISTSDTIIFVDFNSIKRMAELGEEILKSSATKVMIDHHPYPEDIANIMISVPEASSTCELVYNVISSLGWDKYVDKEAAECFYTGIMTDTGSLSYNSSNPDTYRIVAGLLEKEIDKDKIHQLVFHSNSFYRMKLLGHVLGAKMFLMPEHEAAFLWLDKDELEQHNFQPGDTEGFVNYPLSIEGINISAFFMEKDDKIKCSFRSRGDFPVNLFSEQNFNGGGHRNAAGGESMLSMQKTIEKFKKELNTFYLNYKENVK
ncbi:DHH family phosphoesterase [Plebeiibacterium marinum]|uniref:Bifunctional oligoribonuclease/PAP phosphatase NrnA n=1 Tax=Plebeiibacterium marinum TaxID=2992111 RepID=A0AAE3MDI7_9BACT|nr:bifunctional oligoribonuclease/PAP phosphatase NrnA [Plebeiobacterium marinum]MCW3805953.1 bifunctional oligoribonuclease/PAP phosphatase NrnA [Plebeiobacterium marinum]